jgi:3-deoxy-D-manno-octulosonic-acid transferase
MIRLVLFLYSGLYTLALLVYLPFYAARARRQGRSLHFFERTGSVPAGLGAAAEPGKARIWIHAVSLGEANVIKPLVERLAGGPFSLFISTTTEPGQRQARKLFSDCAELFYFPLDWRWSCRRYLHTVRPDLILITETEIWPSFLWEARTFGVPVVLINGRISDRSIPRYLRVRRFLRPVLGWIRTFCMQSRQDKERIISLGAPAERVVRVGNLKYDYELPGHAEKVQLVQWMGRLLKPRTGDLVWLCGSTREGEEEMLADLFLDLRREFPALRWLVAPRHVHRASEVQYVLRGRSLKPVLRSQLDVEEGPIDVLILDSMGELAHLYQLADLVFIGGSLVPWGGHNLIEAASFGKPILVGPHVQNFQEIVDTFLAAYAVVQVSGPDELRERCRDLLRDPTARKWLGANARKVVNQNQGAVKHTLEIVRAVLDEKQRQVNQ